MKTILLLDDIEKQPSKTLNCKFNDKIEDLDTDGNIKADLTARSLGDFIEITGVISCVVNLECDLCLDKFKLNLNFKIKEVFAKHSLLGQYEESGMEFELKYGQFVTDLNGEKEIDICDLLYQSVILNLPNKKVCGINCKGRDLFSEENIEDPRLEVFKNIKINPKNS